MSKTSNQLEEKAMEVHGRLVEKYGTPTRDPEKDPLSQLINTILSQNTNDQNRDLAFKRLRQRFPTWEEVRDAPEDEVIEAIRPAGLAPTKAPRIQAILEKLSEEQGELSLDFLDDMALEDAKRWLLDLKGVGPKTAAIVLLFSLGRPAFPVDTHIHRVSTRLGLIPEGTSREKAHTLLETLIPETIYYPFHLNVIRHGREVCTARSPHCETCKLRTLCDFAQSGTETEA
jgi:endonuclease-3